MQSIVSSFPVLPIFIQECLTDGQVLFLFMLLTKQIKFVGFLRLNDTLAMLEIRFVVILLAFFMQIIVQVWVRSVV